MTDQDWEAEVQSALDALRHATHVTVRYLELEEKGYTVPASLIRHALADADAALDRLDALKEPQS